MKKLLMAIVLLTNFSAYAVEKSYKCKSLAESEDGPAIFSNLTIKVNNRNVALSGKYMAIGETKSEKFKATGNRDFEARTHVTNRYNVVEPFAMVVSLPKSLLEKQKRTIFASFKYLDENKDTVHASGVCDLIKN